MQLNSKFNKLCHFSLCVIDTYGKYALVFLIKTKKDIPIINALQKI